MDNLHRYVPKNGKNFLCIPVHVGGMTIERMRDAKAARAVPVNAAARFEGLEPVPQEFHRCILLMQVYTPGRSCLMPYVWQPF